MIGIVVILLVGSAVGLLFLYSGTTHASTPPSSSSTSSTSTTSSFSTSVSSTSSSSSLSSSSNSQSYVLSSLSKGSAPLFTSNLTTPVSLTQFQGDGLGGDCGGAPCYTYNYNDSGNSWALQGDFEPGTAFLSANSSGITLTDQTCSTPYHDNPLQECGPYWEWNGDKRYVNGVLTGEENVSELSGAISGIPSNAQVFSINVNLPYYNFKGCEFNVSSTGCSYEGEYGPAITGYWALDVSSGSSYYSISMSLSEVCPIQTLYGTCTSSTNSLSVGIGTGVVINGTYQPNLSESLKPLAPSFASFTSDHRLTIATDLRSYLYIWVDNVLEYSSSTIPFLVPSGSVLGLNFYQFDNVDNMTLSTTWKDVTVYATPYIFVSGLSPDMTTIVNGAGSFIVSANANSSGIAAVDVAAQPNNLKLAVEQDGKTIATYSAPVSIGTELQLAT